MELFYLDIRCADVSVMKTQRLKGNSMTNEQRTLHNTTSLIHHTRRRNLMKTLTSTLALGLLVFAIMTQASVFAHGHEEASKKDIVTVAVEAGSFTTLAKALSAAGLIDALKGKGPFTVFAPTDAAFAKLPEGTLENLLKDKEALKNILLYHVVKGKVTAADVVKLKDAKTLSGKKVMITVTDGNVMINESNVSSVDIAAANGVIHVIDEVLIPASK